MSGCLYQMAAHYGRPPSVRDIHLRVSIRRTQTRVSRGVVPERVLGVSTHLANITNTTQSDLALS